MLALVVHCDDQLRVCSGVAAVPALGTGIRLLVRLAIRYPLGEAPASKPSFASLLKLDDEQIVRPVIDAFSVQRSEFAAVTVSALSKELLGDLKAALDSRIQRLPSSASSAQFVPHLVLGPRSGSTRVKWTKEIRVLLGRSGPRKELIRG